MDITLIKKNDSLQFGLEYAKGGSLNIDIKSVYKLQEILGGGQFGTVRVGYRIDNPNKKYAIKSISKTNLEKVDLSKLLTEVQILSNLDHPNIIKLIETYHDRNFLHIVTDLCSGKDVYTHCMQNQSSEKDIALIVFKILSTVAYLFDNAIAHRDIKPTNIIFDSNESNAEVKLIDFGLSFQYKANQKLYYKTGTPYYVSPEVIKGEYDAKCDIWSIGVLTYLLLSGQLPFSIEDSTNVNDLYEKIMKAPVSFHHHTWRSSSRKAIDFVSKCLIKDPKKRMSAIDALNHPWFNSIKKSRINNTIISKDVLEKVLMFSNTNSIFFKKMIIKFVIDSINSNELRHIQDQFTSIDSNCNGTISKNELKAAFQLTNLTISQKELDRLFDKYKGEIRYSDFIVACFDQKKLITKKKLLDAFKYFDIDKNGFIDSKDVHLSFLRIGKELNEEKYISKIIEEVSCLKEGKNDLRITLDEVFALFN